MEAIERLRRRLGEGCVLPACPLALNASRRWDTRRQAALVRYYRAAGADGLAVGVHTTQFAIRRRDVGLYEPLLRLVRDVVREASVPGEGAGPMVLVAGICGDTSQAVAEARLARGLGYDAGLLSLSALRDADEAGLLEHCRSVAAEIPLFGFYLQPAVGGRVLPYAFWRRFAEIEQVVAVKIAPFNRYQTLDVVRAVVESGRDDLALYTGNDDNIVGDLVTPFGFEGETGRRERRIVGGLLGHWAVGTRAAVSLHRRCREASSGGMVSADLLRIGVEVTDGNAAFFDAANGFAGCIAGLHEVLRRQGLLEGVWCLDPNEGLSVGQSAEIDRVLRAYPHLGDEIFVAENRDRWLR
ncbi:MAG: dihydrodipicolinate synthase family protein [Verrucomicrobiales bacterium]|nr:dihydrodipicolinate synthase family protein [Verrucomicrobiales bacterium]